MIPIIIIFRLFVDDKMKKNLAARFRTTTIIIVTIPSVSNTCVVCRLTTSVATYNTISQYYDMFISSST